MPPPPSPRTVELEATKGQSEELRKELKEMREEMKVRERKLEAREAKLEEEIKERKEREAKLEEEMRAMKLREAKLEAKFEANEAKLEEDKKEIQAKLEDVENRLMESQFTTTNPTQLADSVLPLFKQDLEATMEGLNTQKIPLPKGLDLSPPSNAHQAHYNELFKKMLAKTELTAHNCSVANFLTEPNAKVDVVFTRKGRQVMWSEMVLLCEIKADIKASYKQAFGQVKGRSYLQTNNPIGCGSNQSNLYTDSRKNVDVRYYCRLLNCGDHQN